MLIASALADITKIGFKLISMDDFCATFERDVLSVLFPTTIWIQHVTLIQSPIEAEARLYICCVKDGIEDRDEMGLTTTDLAAFSGAHFVKSDRVYQSRRSIK